MYAFYASHLVLRQLVLFIINEYTYDTSCFFFCIFKGSPYVAPSEIVQKIMERLREHDSHEVDTSLYNYDQYSSLHQNGKFSVLSPDNRQFLEQPRSKSPDMHNKRMIIGKREMMQINFNIDI